VLQISEKLAWEPALDQQCSIRFGDFTLNRARGRLEDATGAERFLRPKSYRVLEVLAERCGQLVSKDDLVNEAWPNVFVSDDSLAHCISDIRRAFGPGAADLLRTVPKRGYALAVPGSDSQFPLPPITKLRDMRTGVVALALAVAAAGLSWALHDNERVVEPVAANSLVGQANAFLEARDWRRREDNEQARRLLETALATEPGNSDALASLGLTYWLEVKHLAWGGGRREMERALSLVERAVASGGSARSHRLLAEMRLLAPFPDKRSSVDALASARAAVAIDGDDPDNLAVLAQALALTGRSTEAVGMIEQALLLKQSPPDWYHQIAGLSYLLAGEPTQAAEQLGPLYGAGTFANARWWSGWLFAASLAHAGRTDEASRVVESALARRPERNASAVAQSLYGLFNEEDLRLVLDGLRLAGMRG
jgi:DNA-binding winged helix-turn-helix (wHTH) protein/tetratricopeptide (TPR) repeat protein